MPPAGFEQHKQYSGCGGLDVCAAKINAVGPNYGLIDPDLSAVIEAWPALPEAVRVDILAMIRADM